MRVIAIVGATATGKTDLAEALAERLGGEVVCADSRQVFRALDLGTGKPSGAMLAARPHHLFDALEIGERASAGWWAKAAVYACRSIETRGRVPVLVGGTGLYVRALQHGIASEPPHDAALRERLGAEALRLGTPALHAQLAEVDSATAARVAPTDTQRVTRALEVWFASGKPLSWWHRERAGAPLDADWGVVELVLDPVTLAQRIAHRTHTMFEQGLVEETRALTHLGGGAALRALHAVGYDEALDLLEGRIDRATAEERTNQRTRQLAKRQRTWFRHQIEAARIDVAEPAVGDLLERTLESLGDR